MERIDLNVGVLNHSLDNNYIDKLMLSLAFNNFENINSLNEAKKNKDGLVLINKDNNNIEEFINQEFENIGIILFVEDKDYYDVFNLVYDKGIIVVPKSIDMICLLEIMKLLAYSSLKKMKYDSKDKKNELKLMDVAKSIVIIRHKKSEDDAHKYILRASMNYRMTTIRTAKIIISNHIRRGISYEY